MKYCGRIGGMNVAMWKKQNKSGIQWVEEMKEGQEDKDDWLWVPQKAGAYKKCYDALQLFIGHNVPGIRITRSGQEKVYGFRISRDFDVDVYGDKLKSLIAEGDWLRIQRHCARVENYTLADCLEQAVQQIQQISRCRLEADICSPVNHVKGTAVSCFDIADGWFGGPCLSVYIAGRNLSTEEQTLLDKLDMGQHIEISGVLQIYRKEGVLQLRSESVPRVLISAEESFLEKEKNKFYADYSELENISDIEPEHRFREQMKAVSVPWRLGLITPESSRGGGDFENKLKEISHGKILITVRQNVPLTDPAKIKEAVNWLVTGNQCDCIAIIRGGGRSYDLRAFHTADLACVMAGCTLPVILGIGHAGDRFLCEKAAGLVGITPTDAAVRLMGVYYQIRKMDQIKKEEGSQALEEKIRQVKEENERLQKEVIQWHMKWEEVVRQLQEEKGRREQEKEDLLTRLRGLSQKVAGLSEENKRRKTSAEATLASIIRYVFHGK